MTNTAQTLQKQGACQDIPPAPGQLSASVPSARQGRRRARIAKQQEEITMEHKDSSHALLHEAQELGYEGRVRSQDPASLKLWLRMMACTKQVEDEIRRRLRLNFDISLARFDYMAQLYRYPDGLKMGELSRYLMVTGGNITGLTDELSREGLVSRASSPTDRRAWILRLTPEGRSSFEVMAKAHAGWVTEMFSGLEPEAVRQLHQHLGALRVHLVNLAAGQQG
ncbi:MarR family winged helix-turn-helix transcriptional regulator [Kerstersia gyiorum]|uniref:MarR family winged helix-turn-helix transcriptional regulator n=1 Tax=Kerstersia gyiorum TaxID=206506 RepID=UPI0039EA3CD5